MDGKASDADVTANKQLLDIFSADKRHYESSTMSVMLLFLSANAGLLATMELLTKTLGPVPLGLVGLATVLISVLSVVDPHRQWRRAMTKGFEVQSGLQKWGIKLLATPFGSVRVGRSLGTTALVHLTVSVFWILYLLRHNPTFEAFFQKMTGLKFF